MSEEKTYWTPEGEALNTQHYTKSLYQKREPGVPIRKDDISDYEMKEEDLIALAIWARSWREESEE